MAKLEGVKVIDMENGEITKIAYNGAEYEAEELSYAAQQEGDIVLNTTETNDATLGGYYEVGTDGYVKDDVGVIHTNIQFRGRTFRKITVPSKRVPKPGDKIRITKPYMSAGEYDKGDILTVKVYHPGSSFMYERVDVEEFEEPSVLMDEFEFADEVMGEIQEGDYVVPLQSTVGVYTVTKHGEMKLGKVTDTYRSCIDIKVVSHNKSRGEGNTYTVRAKHFRKATAEEIAEHTKPKFEKGDRVKLVIKDGEKPRYSWGDVRNGDIGTVIRVTEENSVRVGFPKQRNWRALPSELELLPAGEMSVGDYAKVIGKTYFGDIRAGAFVKITDDIDEDDDLEIELLDGSDCDYAKPESLEKVSEEEAKKAEEQTKKLPVGSYAKVVQNGHPQEGNIVKITRNDYDHSGGYIYETEKLNGDSGDIYRIDGLAAATDEEVKLAKIGRKKGEFKEGDIVRVTMGYSGIKEGDIGIARTDETDGIPLVYIPSRDEEYFVKAELIAPASARVDIA